MNVILVRTQGRDEKTPAERMHEMNLLTVTLLVLALLLLLFLLLVPRTGRKNAAMAVLVLSAVTLVGFFVRSYAIVCQTPEAAYAATNPGRRAREVICGDNTALVLAGSGETRRWQILERTEKGWRIGNPFRDELRSLGLFDDGYGFLYHRSGSPDYYVELNFPDGADHRLEDSLGSTFFRADLSETGSCYYAVLRDWSADYTLILDGEALELSGESAS